jgi:hypothetical protein
VLTRGPEQNQARAAQPRPHHQALPSTATRVCMCACACACGCVQATTNMEALGKFAAAGKSADDGAEVRGGALGPGQVKLGALKNHDVNRYVWSGAGCRA